MMSGIALLEGALITNVNYKILANRHSTVVEHSSTDANIKDSNLCCKTFYSHNCCHMIIR